MACQFYLWHNMASTVFFSLFVLFIAVGESLRKIWNIKVVGPCDLDPFPELASKYIYNNKILLCTAVLLAGWNHKKKIQYIGVFCLILLTHDPKYVNLNMSFSAGGKKVFPHPVYFTKKANPFCQLANSLNVRSYNQWKQTELWKLCKMFNRVCTCFG